MKSNKETSKSTRNLQAKRTKSQAKDDTKEEKNPPKAKKVEQPHQPAITRGKAHQKTGKFVKGTDKSNESANCLSDNRDTLNSEAANKNISKDKLPSVSNKVTLKLGQSDAMKIDSRKVLPKTKTSKFIRKQNIDNSLRLAPKDKQTGSLNLDHSYLSTVNDASSIRRSHKFTETLKKYTTEVDSTGDNIVKMIGNCKEIIESLKGLDVQVDHERGVLEVSDKSKTLLFFEKIEEFGLKSNRHLLICKDLNSKLDQSRSFNEQSIDIEANELAQSEANRKLLGTPSKFLSSIQVRDASRVLTRPSATSLMELNDLKDFKVKNKTESPNKTFQSNGLLHKERLVKYSSDNRLMAYKQLLSSCQERVSEITSMIEDIAPIQKSSRNPKLSDIQHATVLRQLTQKFLLRGSPKASVGESDSSEKSISKISLSKKPSEASAASGASEASNIRMKSLKSKELCDKQAKSNRPSLVSQPAEPEANKHSSFNKSSNSSKESAKVAVKSSRNSKPLCLKEIKFHTTSNFSKKDSEDQAEGIEEVMEIPIEESCIELPKHKTKKIMRLDFNKTIKRGPNTNCNILIIPSSTTAARRDIPLFPKPVTVSRNPKYKDRHTYKSYITLDSTRHGARGVWTDVLP